MLDELTLEPDDEAALMALESEVQEHISSIREYNRDVEPVGATRTTNLTAPSEPEEDSEEEEEEEEPSGQGDDEETDIDEIHSP
eukprot:CAMPEP_0177584902 /NCGR_PEP_ID=MMETSP0419_2-20121207/4174_1 /TAXON_ID=582737 /ORGANISM="Tetraselmis sp., Strain GSL018" /LENGTH=83 /DNA_ID=CAMNT_0019074533 /DNA_START=513 /DNA_END=764 /DNA_ORIENTATION=+